MSIHCRIKQARQQGKISQARLGKLLGVSRSACSQWESDNGATPSVEHLIKMAILLKIRFEWLSTGRGTMNYADEFNIEESSVNYYSKDILEIDEQELLIIFNSLEISRRKVLLAFLKNY
ncbi:MAG: helix-turn-helix transcriptional regulator [Methylococcales bacterium]|nr:helix-turn-helix transcriptional regulator [Methylococcales bacterium]MBT7411316.1 helix-turn-helix transcriptional regulator [Methylococcales bacterium]